MFPKVAARHFVPSRTSVSTIDATDRSPHHAGVRTKGPRVAARIYQEAKNPMQSGRGRAGRWVLEFDAADRQRHDPVTGWIGSADTQQQVRLTFPSLDAASAYATREGLAFEVRRGSERVLKLQAYADNFR